MKMAGSCDVTNGDGSFECTNSWLSQFRRLLVRHEHLISIYLAFFYLACF